MDNLYYFYCGKKYRSATADTESYLFAYWVSFSSSLLTYTFFRSQEVVAWWNDSTIGYKICHDFGMRKPDIPTYLSFYCVPFSKRMPWTDQGIFIREKAKLKWELLNSNIGNQYIVLEAAWNFGWQEFNNQLSPKY